MIIKNRLLDNEKERTYRILLKKVMEENIIPIHHIPTKNDIINNKSDFIMKYKYYCEHIKTYPKIIRISVIKNTFSQYLIFLKHNYLD